MENVYTIGGVRIQFPFKPYPSQISLMNHIIKALNNGENCLLESPTGSGKTLALLCSSIAWQQKIAENLCEQLAVKEGCHGRDAALTQTNGVENVIQSDSDSFEDVFVATKKNVVKRKRASNLKTEAKVLKMEDTNMETATTIEESEMKPLERCKKIPRIFYCTRTHKQLAQIASELKGTCYANPKLKMTILSSREHSCINKAILKENKTNSSISEACQRLLKNQRLNEQTCHYYRNVEKCSNYKHLTKEGLPNAFDIEELVQVGKKCKACPFFISKQIYSESSLVLCPYNYVIDPQIRSYLELDISNSIIILDEAHNIEDICRSSMSLSFVNDQIANSINDIKNLTHFYQTHDNMGSFYGVISGFLCGMKSWLSICDDKLQVVDFNTEKYVMMGSEAARSLTEDAAINDVVIDLVVENLSKIRSTCNSMKEEVSYYIPEMTDGTKQLLDSLILVLKNVFHIKNVNDYVVSFHREQASKLQSFFDPSYRSRSSNNVMQLVCTFTCLNPALSFNLLATETRSVILASGTLSPMASFGPELGASFNVLYEANQTKMSQQAWVAGLSSGPNNTPIKLTYQYYSALEVQDQIGQVIYDICTIIPNGVLCFLPSFKIMDVLTKRWIKTGLWDKIKKTKHAFIENKGMTNEGSDTMMKEYSNCSHGFYDNKNQLGAVMFAVCRGKSSEGIDFSDEKARAVITVGIPFPNIKTPEISEKMKYNDKNCKKVNQNFLSGEEWYKIQAYRALNQALGRCVRHSNDWGAIILLDARFCLSDKRYGPVSHLSKWIRDRFKPFFKYGDFLDGLRVFINSKQSKTNSLLMKSSTQPEIPTKFDSQLFGTGISSVHKAISCNNIEPRCDIKSSHNNELHDVKYCHNIEPRCDIKSSHNNELHDVKYCHNKELQHDIKFCHDSELQKDIKYSHNGELHDVKYCHNIEPRCDIKSFHNIEPQHDAKSSHNNELQHDIKFCHDSWLQKDIKSSHNDELQHDIKFCHDSELQKDIKSSHNDELQHDIKFCHDSELQKDIKSSHNIEPDNNSISNNISSKLCSETISLPETEIMCSKNKQNLTKITSSSYLNNQDIEIITVDDTKNNNGICQDIANLNQNENPLNPPPSLSSRTNNNQSFLKRSIISADKSEKQNTYSQAPLKIITCVNCQLHIDLNIRRSKNKNLFSSFKGKVIQFDGCPPCFPKSSDKHFIEFEDAPELKNYLIERSHDCDNLSPESRETFNAHFCPVNKVLHVPLICVFCKEEQKIWRNYSIKDVSSTMALDEKLLTNRYKIRLLVMRPQ